MKYYKRDSESVLGEGVAFMAVDLSEDQVVQQVEFYGDQAFWSDLKNQSDERFMLSDQPASEIGLGEEYEINQAEFENAWTKAQSACQ